MLKKTSFSSSLRLVFGLVTCRASAAGNFDPRMAWIYLSFLAVLAPPPLFSWCSSAGQLQCKMQEASDWLTREGKNGSSGQDDDHSTIRLQV